MKKNSSIRSLEQKANGGGVKSAFQLYEYYSVGKFVDKDLVVAEKYAGIAFDHVKNFPLKIHSLMLKGFKGFSGLHVNSLNDDGNSNVVVFCGPNGAGKTTILTAISKCLSWFSARVTSPKNTGESLEFSDINCASTYATVIATFFLGQEEFQIDLSKSISDSPTQKNNALIDFSLLSEMYHQLNLVDKGSNFPLIAFYGVERAVEFSPKDERLEEVIGEGRQEKFDGYRKSLSGYADFKLFFKWFKYHQDIINSDKSSILDKVNVINGEIQELIETIKKSEESGSTISPVLRGILSERQLELERLNLEVEYSKDDISERIVRIVTNAFSEFLPGFTNFRIQYKPVTGMVVDKSGVTLSVQQLSHGEKSLLALIGDISRRLVLLNPSLDNPLVGSGIVMIDEIDLHLHPAWQQNVIPKLSLVFPNIQFLITTHSPQVLTTVSSDSIRVIAHEMQEDGVVISTASTPQMQSKGTTSADVMAEIQLVDPIPNVEEAHWLSEYKKLIVQNEHDSFEGLVLKEKIVRHFGVTHQEWLECERLIRLQVMRAKLSKSSN